MGRPRRRVADNPRQHRAILADWSAAQLRQRGGIELAWSETSNADDFSKNLVRLRVERR